MNKISLMIVDDHTLLRETWGKLLSLNSQYEIVMNTGDGHEAITAAKEKQPDLVLLDINMVPLSGFDILKSISKDSPRTKVIGVSMHTQPGYVKKMIKYGARGYVTKNSPSDELVHAMEEVMAGRLYICKEVKNILSSQVVEQDNNNINNITQKQMEVIELMKQGLSSRNIAKALGVTEKTIEVHRHNIYKKLDVKNSLSLIKLVNERGL